MKVLNLLTSGDAGGIESLCRDIGLNSQFDNGFCFLFARGAIYEQMTEMGLKTYCLENDCRKISLQKYSRLKSIAKDYDIIAVHHGDPFLKLYHWLLSKTMDKKFVTFIHSCYEKAYFYPESKIKRFFAHKIFQMDLASSNMNIFVSKYGENSYQSVFKIANGKSTVVYNGIDVGKLKQGEKNTPSHKEPYNLTFIGRLADVKGLDLLLQAASNLRCKYNIKVSIVGKGSEENKLKKKASELKIADIVTFYGQQKDIVPFLMEASIFVYPSVWQEAFGISLVEAMAFGIPCVSNAVGGIPEIIQNGVSGFLCDDTTSEALIRRVEEVIQMIQTGSISEVSSEAKNRARQFSILNTVDNLQRVYESLI